jgi:hypothetical protein
MASSGPLFVRGDSEDGENRADMTPTSLKSFIMRGGTNDDDSKLLKRISGESQKCCKS